MPAVIVGSSASSAHGNANAVDAKLEIHICMHVLEQEAGECSRQHTARVVIGIIPQRHRIKMVQPSPSFLALSLSVYIYIYFSVPFEERKEENNYVIMSFERSPLSIWRLNCNFCHFTWVWFRCV